MTETERMVAALVEGDEERARRELARILGAEENHAPDSVEQD